MYPHLPSPSTFMIPIFLSLLNLVALYYYYWMPKVKEKKKREKTKDTAIPKEND